MKRLTLLSFVPALILGANLPVFAEQSAATVTQVVNDVSHGSSASTATTPATTGTKLNDGEYLKTGASSRAELQLANQTITRLGANTIFNYSVAANEIDLQAGTMLFSKPKDGKTMTIKTAAVTAAVTGTTVIVAKLPNGGVIIAPIEGHVNIPGVGTLNAGQMLVDIPGQPPQIISIDLPLLVKTSGLITKFSGRLPNWKYIEAAIAAYLDDESRGYITKTKPPFYVYDTKGAPEIPLTTFDSPGTGLLNFEISQIPPPPRPQEECCWCCGDDDGIKFADVAGGKWSGKWSGTWSGSK